MHRVLIRPLAVNDAEVSFRWRNDPDIWKYTGKRPDRIITQEIEHNWILKALADSTSRRFAIEVDGMYVGNIQITDIAEHIDGQYHIFIGEKQFWGKGVATQATLQIIRYAKEILNLNSLYLYVNPLHSSAIKLYQRCGFNQASDGEKMILDLAFSPKPMVSVQMITYNHERYVRRAILSILMQRTSYDFNIVIGEDCSTDKTRNIIKSIAEKYPGKFKLILHNKNVGALANQQSVSEASESKYITICEGDDYWADAYKLQKQVDFLEKNQEYGLTFGNVMVLTSEGKLYPRCSRRISTFEDILRVNGIGTATICFRKNLFDRFELETQAYKQEWIMGDYPFYFWLFINSRMYGFDDSFAVYRKHEGSSTDFGNFKKGEAFLRAIIKIKTYFYSFYKGNSSLKEFLREEYISLFRISLHHSKVFKVIRYFWYYPGENIRFLVSQIKF